ncbi:MAG: response regulator [Nitrospirae bacterium]|nr:response regulator [Nitrospirota bacterium]MBF0534160.1 response regulator [Nitrospirota bacterium]MBF0617047.1 response regulator [Nitrospirota bacterium]
MIKNLKIGTRIAIGYLLMLFVFLLLFSYSISRLDFAANQIKNLYEHPFTVKGKLLSTDANIFRARYLLRKAYFLPNNEAVLEMKTEISAIDPEILNDLTVAEDMFLGDKKIIRNIRKNYEKYISLHDDYFDLLLQGKKTEAEKQLDTKLYENATDNEKLLKEAIEFASVKAKLFYENTQKSNNESRNILYFILAGAMLICSVFAFIFTRSITSPIRRLILITKEIGSGNLNINIDVSERGEIGQLSKSFLLMTENLRNISSDRDIEDWKKTGYTQIGEIMRGEQDVITLSQRLIVFISEYMGALIGAIYLTQKTQNTLKLTGTYAHTKRKNLSNEFAFGDGVTGQAALEKQSILLTEVPEDYIKITSGLGESAPSNILVTPLIYNGEVKGVIELGAFTAFTERHMEFMKSVSEAIAISFGVVQSRDSMKELLILTQNQSEELQEQQEELRANNEALANQTKTLRASELKLQEQQEELRQANEELEEHARLMEKQRDEIKKKNIQLERNQELNLQKTRELEITSKYKSEFLANMSHELRTPLNSVLLLSKFLMENKEGNLTEKQVECASTVYSSGNDLLLLINDILDLSKVEAGKVELNIGAMETDRLKTFIVRTFSPFAEEKNLSLQVIVSENAPKYIHTDVQKTEQIIRNLLSNAIKFTEEKGFIRVMIDKDSLGNALSISVSDTGIGIHADKLGVIFEAFKQADGTTSRRFGGTGLGLTISKELVKLLRGEITVKSEVGSGSTFTILIPDVQHVAPSDVLSEKTLESKSQLKLIGKVSEDDRESMSPDDKSILIIEDDIAFAKILLEISRERGYKCIIAQDGGHGIGYAHKYKPNAIILDMGLPDLDGWTVIERLKDSSETRNIPIHIISASEKNIDVMKSGSVGYLTKPVNMKNIEEAFNRLESIYSDEKKQILAINLNIQQETALKELLKNTYVGVDYVSAKKAQKIVESNQYNFIIMNITDNEPVSFTFLDIIKNSETLCNIPVIIYNSSQLSVGDEIKLNMYAHRIVLKTVKSPDRLLDEIVLFLHLEESQLPEEKQKILLRVHDKEHIFKNRNILVTDDDSRNVFALTSILEGEGMNVFTARNGTECLDILKKNDTLEVILMDIMMPEMDGYAAISEVRKIKQYKEIPIIALTAKAMKEDRMRCIEAGANDYISKPVDKDRLLSLLRIWLYQ